MVTELMSGGDLAQLIEKKRSLTVIQKCQMAKDIAKALRWCHESKPPVIHRDLKPSNWYAPDYPTS
jgi:serine/threonine protein kinase